MYLINQVLIYLAFALIIGGGIGYALRSCLADTACDDVREDLALSHARYEALLDREHGKLIPHHASEATAPVSGTNTSTSLASLDSHDFEAALLKAAPGRSLKPRFGPDDLTSIIGITPKSDVWLGLNGITRFAHIASLTAPELYWLVENLPENGGSVYRDHWVAQARNLMEQA